MFQQDLTPVANSLTASALIALLPLVTIFMCILVYLQSTPVLSWMLP